MNGNEVGYFDMADEDLHITNSLHVAGTASVGATFEAADIRATNSLEVQGDIELDTLIASGSIIGVTGEFEQDVRVGGQLEIQAGSVPAPGLIIDGDPDTGISGGALGPDTFSFVAGGVAALHLTSTSSVAALPILGAGLASAPTFSFFFNQDMGMYRAGSGVLGFSVSGVEKMTLDDDFHVVNSIVAGSSIIGATFECDSLESVGDVTVGGHIDVALDGVEFSRLGPVPSTNVGGDTSDILVSTKVSDTGSIGGIRRGGMFVAEWDGTSASASTAFAGLNSFARSNADSTQDLTTSTNPAGSLIGGRYVAQVQGAGAVPLAGGVASRATVADAGGLLTEGYAFFDEGGDGGSGNGMTYYSGLWIKDSAGVVGQKTGIWIEDLNNAVSENIGIQIDGAAQNVLWLGAGAANTDEANGIVWGAGRDVNLYRSDNNELTTDDAFVSNSLTIGADSLTALAKVSTFEDLADSAGVLTSDGGGVYSWGAGGAAANTNPNLIINGSAQINQRVNCTSTSTYANDDFGLSLDHVTLVSDGNNACDVIQNTAERPDGGSHCFELLTQTDDVKFGLLFPLDKGISAELFSAADDRKCSIQFKYKATAGVQNIRAQVLSYTGATPDQLVDPISDWQAGTADIDPTYVATWTPNNTGVQIATTTDWQTYTLENVAMDTAGAVNVALLIHVADIDLDQPTDIIYIADVHMNEGATISTYVRPTRRQEYDDCIRYFQKTFPTEVEPKTQAGRNGVIVSKHWTGTNVDAGVNYQYQTQMNNNPVLTFYNPVNNNAEWFEDNNDNDNGAVVHLHDSQRGSWISHPNSSGPGNADISLVHMTADAELLP
jgi:hypothetical protein